MPIVSAMKDLRRFSWNNLAIDVQINVMRFLSVPSIFLLRKLCTASYKASLARSIWTSAIQIDMEYHHIPSFTFPLSSLDRLVLERLAMSPYLFDRLLTGPQNAIPPRHIQILVNQLDETTLAKMSIASLVKGYGSMHLVPGGRFLVTSSQVIMKNDELKTLLQLWDIGVRGHGSRNKIIVSLLLESEEEVPISLAPSLVGNDFYVICDEPGVAIKAYKVANLTSSPTITLLNTFETQVGGRDVESTSLVVSANRVACILGDNYLAIWDFEANTSTILATDLELTSEVSMYLYPHCLQMYGNSLFLTHAGKLFVWNIPELGAAGDSEHGHQPVVVFANLVPDDEEASDEPSVRMIPQSPSSYALSRQLPSTLLSAPKRDSIAFRIIK
ncbi:hypothetical protein NLJ89_g2061 [Agrocybe chaxingu]|uniref:F-box domain-containing protein n=1 Tax=Agrocybe chaxingu TaxID=84603 RepID=A0A9W8K7C6_9AGAR|nr:hypothetical protein NLJ89_g2061 [Agrocybe chaxingu]